MSIKSRGGMVRNPRHPEALTKDELVFGLMFQLFRDGEPCSEPMLVIDEPYQVLSQFDRKPYPDWRIRVLIADGSGGGRPECFYLSQLGVKKHGEWQHEAYALAVDCNKVADEAKQRKRRKIK